LLLDEPTANLDVNSEAFVMQSLSGQTQTTLLVTHQLTDTQHYDTIWVMDQGMIVQTGDYVTLSQTEGPFARLIASREEAQYA
jgi:ATP-binding cassette subfamily C protein CydD